MKRLPRGAAVLLALIALIASAALHAACYPMAPDSAPNARCENTCQKVATHCSEQECRRGCEFIVDRMVEREDGTVVKCMSKRRPACNDRAWAYCAARVGAHLDGGPPLPPGIPDEEWD